MSTRHQNYVFIFNKECLKEQGFDQEEQDKNAKFEDDILFYSTLDPTKLGGKLSDQIIQKPNCAFTIYIIADYLVENKQDDGVRNDEPRNIFPKLNDAITMTGLYTFIDECLDEIGKILTPRINDEDIEDLDIEMSVFCIAVESVYNEGHIPRNFHQSLSNEVDVFKGNYKSIHRNNINLNKLKIHIHEVGYNMIRKKEATNELIALKNSIMLKKDKPDIIFKYHIFFKNNETLNTFECSLDKFS